MTKLLQYVRAFELYVQQKTPVEVAIALNLEAEKAINYYHQYFMLLGITEFTRAYLQVKDILGHLLILSIYFLTMEFLE